MFFFFYQISKTKKAQIVYDLGLFNMYKLFIYIEHMPESRMESFSMCCVPLICFVFDNIVFLFFCWDKVKYNFLILPRFL